MMNERVERLTSDGDEVRIVRRLTKFEPRNEHRNRQPSLDPQRIQRFHRLLFSWYRINQRDLPWRKTHDPYKILVSEVMLQQTQVDRVIPKYQEFIRRYPTARSLARTKIADVLRLWSGLGYNRRAIYLKQSAVIIVDRWKNRWPRSVEGLRVLPGVGHYTAAAILSFAFNQDVPLADTNVKRVIGRLFIGPTWPEVSEQKILKVVETVLPKGKSRLFPHAVMDLGSALARRDPSRVVWQKEFPELFIREPRTDNRKQVWQGSNRQLRGAIIRRLLQGRISIDALARDLSLPLKRLEGLIGGLSRDGLVISSKREVTLP